MLRKLSLNISCPGSKGLGIFIQLGLLSCLSSPAVAQDAELEQPPVNPKHVYPPEFVQEYLQECRELAIAEGLLPEDAQILCECTIKTFQEQYSYQDYQQLDQAVKEEVGYDCFDQILYEE